jgi:ribosomal-protein-alanine N-acetyltransferase
MSRGIARSVRVAETAGVVPDPSSFVDDLAVEIHPMRRRHLRRVLDIEADAYPRPWSLRLFLSEIALRSSRAYYVAVVEGVVVGYAGVMMAGDEGHVTTIAVDAAARRRGVGKRLLLAVTAEALRRGATRMTLEVRASNKAAQRMYAAFGYAPVGVRRNYYAETREDAIIMTASDVRSSDYVARLQGISRTIPGRTLLR